MCHGILQHDDAERIARQAVKIGAAQIESELRDALELAASLRPDVVVEIGCYLGGTLYAWRQICERVYGITLLTNNKYLSGTRQPLESHGAVMCYGDSRDAGTLDWLKSELNGSPVDMLVIDADHLFEGVRQDFMSYAPLVRTGGVILLHDVLLRYPAFEDPEFQVWRLWEQLQEAGCDASVIGSEVGWGVVRVREEDNFTQMVAGMTYQ